MAKKIEKLKKFYIANGGSAEDVAGIRSLGDMIDALCNIEFDSELPTVTGSDNGKVLGVVEGAWGKATVPAELPAVTSDDNGKVLKVAEGAWGKGDVPTELPAVTSDDNGKVLGVANGAWGKADIPAELPAVTSDDNGKVLAVANGAWDKAEAQGGNNDFVVTYTPTGETSATADKTFAEISAAYNANKNLKAKMTIAGADYSYILSQFKSDYGVVFICLSLGGNTVTAIQITHTDNDTITTAMTS